MTGAIEAYVLALDDALALPDVLRLRTLEEAEAHLRDAVDDEVDRGASPEQAARRAIDRFGSPEAVAAAAHREHRLLAAPATLLRRFDRWRARHLVLGAIAGGSAFALLGWSATIPFALVLGSSGWSLAPVDARPLRMTVGWIFGQLLLGLAVRRRPEPGFAARVRAVRDVRPRTVQLLLMGPLALAFLGPSAAGPSGAPEVLLVIATLSGALLAPRSSARLGRLGAKPLVAIAFVLCAATAGLLLHPERFRYGITRALLSWDALRFAVVFLALAAPFAGLIAWAYRRDALDRYRARLTGARR